MSMFARQYPDTKLYLENKGVPNHFQYGKASTFSRVFRGKEVELKWFAADCDDANVLTELFSRYVTGFLHTFFLIHEKEFSKATEEVNSILVNWPNGFSNFIVGNYCFIYDDTKWYEEDGYYLSFFSNKLSTEHMEELIQSINKQNVLE